MRLVLRTRKRSSGSRRRPVRLNLIGLADAVTTLHSGQARHIVDMDQGVAQTVYDYLLTREQLRLDLQQVFVNRKEEEDAVVALHFPSEGRSRQIKFRLSLKQELLLMANQLPPGDARLADAYAALALGRRAPTPAESRFQEQGLVDFEQLCANFFYAALPALVKCAALLARLNLARRVNDVATQPAMPGETQEPEEPDGFEEFIVNRDKGWPVLRERFRLHDIVRLPPEHAKRDVDAGYLMPLKKAESNLATWGSEFGEAIAAYRERRRAAAEATLRRPTPTDTEALLATSDGRKTREQIIAALEGIAADVFPPSQGRPLARTTDERTALVAELRDDYNQRRAKYVARGIRKTRPMVLEEMHADGRYGPAQESLSVATIQKLLSTREKQPQRLSSPDQGKKPRRLSSPSQRKK